MKYPLELIEKLLPFVEELIGVEQKPLFHPEGDAFNHTGQVVRIALRESKDIDLVMAALLHDIGKKENSLGHEKIAIQWLADLCTPKTLWLIENHMKVRCFLDGTMVKRSTCDRLFYHEWFKDLILLTRWDSAGRKPKVKYAYIRQNLIDKLLKIQEGNDVL